MTKQYFECDQEIQRGFGDPISTEPHPCGWKSGAEDYDEPRYCYNTPYCPRCGFVLPHKAPLNLVDQPAGTIE